MNNKENTLSNDLATKGYTLLLASNEYQAWQTLLNKNKGDLDRFHEHWSNLPADEFLGDGGHYRYRRYSVFNWLMEEEQLELLPHEPHFQSTYRNNMNGGIYREFEPFEKQALDNPVLPTIVKFVAQHISYNNQTEWRIQAHQFRIVANDDEAGLPTPEGIHKDGADFILIMLFDRKNIRGGVNHIYDQEKRLVFGGILETLGDAVIVDDREVWHGVSEVYPEDDSQESHRDVLVLTFHNETMA